uniref:Chondroitin proteoglycan 3 n=2 Tax=Ascaris TaxID=6251 RepID=A0A0M3HXD7_ASCLU
MQSCERKGDEIEFDQLLGVDAMITVGARIHSVEVQMSCVKFYCILLLCEFALAVTADDVALSGGSVDEGSGEEEEATIKAFASEGTPPISTTPSPIATKMCIPSMVCYSDSDCNKGKCIGIALGKCNCGACATFVPCKDDSACGGLIGACSKENGFCDCDRGFKANGIESIFTALADVCNVKDCAPNNGSCFGLPCNTGVCACL